MWAIFRFLSNFSGAAIQDVWGSFLGIGGWVGEGGEGRGRDLVVPIAGTMTWGYYKTNDNPLVIAPLLEQTRSRPPYPPPTNPQYQKKHPTHLV